MFGKEKGSGPIKHELVCIVAWALVLYGIARFSSQPVYSSITLAVALSWLFFNPGRFDLINLTHGWLTNWDKAGGIFKELVRDMSLSSINHGWFYAIRMEPVYAWRNLCHAISWLPFLYRDRDWDHQYLLMMMREKLRRMADHQEKHGNHVGHIETAAEIRVAVAVLDRLIKSDYAAEDYEAHMAKYGSVFDRMEKLPDGSAISHPHPDPGCGEDIRRIADREEALIKQDLEFLGSYLAKHMRNWWD